MSPTELTAALHHRYATKAFDPAKKIPADAWEALELALRLAPSSFGLQPWKFLVIDDPALRAELRTVSWGQSKVTEASHLVVFLTRTDLTLEDIDRWMDHLAPAQGRTPGQLKGYRDVIANFVEPMPVDARHAWNLRQSYIALGQFMISAATLGVDTCPLEGFSPADYNRILKLAGTGYVTACACAAGYRSALDAYSAMPKARFPHEEVIEHR